MQVALTKEAVNCLNWFVDHPDVEGNDFSEVIIAQLSSFVCRDGPRGDSSWNPAELIARIKSGRA